MANNRNSPIYTPDQTVGDFSESDFILNYKPRIDFVEPDQLLGDETETHAPGPEPEVPPTIDELRERTQKLIDSYGVVEKLADVTEKRIDQRVDSAGGFNMKLDPVVDDPVIAAMKRVFPEQDPTVITYDNYKRVLECLKKESPVPPTVSLSDIQDAKADPYRTDFGGYSNQNGQNRPEISSPMSSVQPLDLQKFQSAAVLALFALLLPLIKVENQKTIAQHLATTPHGPL